MTTAPDPAELTPPTDPARYGRRRAFGVAFWAVLAIAGQLSRASQQDAGEGDFPIRGPLFITLLIITVLLIGGLSFLPVLALGPVAEHLLILGAL